jgi:hypothetical protein
MDGGGGSRPARAAIRVGVRVGMGGSFDLRG